MRVLAFHRSRRARLMPADRAAHAKSARFRRLYTLWLSDPAAAALCNGKANSSQLCSLCVPMHEKLGAVRALPAGGVLWDLESTFQLCSALHLPLQPA